MIKGIAGIPLEIPSTEEWYITPIWDYDNPAGSAELYIEMGGLEIRFLAWVKPGQSNCNIEVTLEDRNGRWIVVSLSAQNDPGSIRKKAQRAMDRLSLCIKPGRDLNDDEYTDRLKETLLKA